MFRKLRRWRLISYSMSRWEKEGEDGGATQKERGRGKDLERGGEGRK